LKNISAALRRNFHIDILLKHSLLVISLLVFYVAGYGKSFLVTRDIIYAHNGKMDLSAAPWQEKVFGLYGQWEFYWKQLLTPEDLQTGKYKPYYVSVPQTWTKYVLPDGTHPGKFGYATYHLKIKLPPDIHEIGLSFHGIFNQYRLWINGRFIDEHGKVATDAKHSKPTWLPETYYLHIDGDSLDIVLQVSNYQHFKAGIVRQIVVGRPSLMQKFDIINVGIDSALMGTMLIFALFFFFVFYYKKEDLSAIYFVITLVGQALITGLDGEYVLYRIFPNLSWYLGLHLLFFLFFYRTLTFLNYLYQLLKKEFSFKVLVFFTVIASVGCIYSIFAPVSSFQWLLYLYMFLAMISIFYVVFILMKSIKYQIGALYTLLGIGAVFFTGLNDILYDFNILHTFYMSGFGLFVFLFTLSIMMAMHNARAERQIIIYSYILKKLDVLRNELLKIPFYDIGRALKVVASVLKLSRGVWIDKEKDYFVRYEVKLNKLKEISTGLSQLGQEFLPADVIKQADETGRTFIYPVSKKEKRLVENRRISDKFPLSAYMARRGVKSVMATSLKQRGEVVSLLYFEEYYKFINLIHKRILEASASQLVSMKNNAENFEKLRQLNLKLETIVAERTKVLKEKEAELKKKETELREKMEELQAYNEELNTINLELEHNKTVIEQKSFELEKLHNEILRQKNFAEHQNKIYRESLEFARNIQAFVLQEDTGLPFRDYFVFYQPRGLVGGDFYWLRNLGGKVLLVAADCTGHSIPGAFMSILGATLLDDIIREYFVLEKNPDITPSHILYLLRDKLLKALGSDSSYSYSAVHDGMDMALALYNPDTKLLEFAGAYMPLWVIRDGELIELRGDRFPVGMYVKISKIKSFTDKTITLKQGDRLYMFSDGYADQFNPLGEKFYKKNFRKLLIEISGYPASLQKEILYTTFKEWKGQTDQTDDVLIVGIII